MRRAQPNTALTPQPSRGMGADRAYAFATAAVRRPGGGEFVRLMSQKFGLCVTVLTGEEEAAAALYGALGEGDGLVIDLGGASTEVAVRLSERTVYSHSLNVGAVVLKDKFGTDKSALAAYIAQKTQEYGNIPPASRRFAVGGTACSLAACALGLTEYSSVLVHGSRLTAAAVLSIAEETAAMPPEQVAARYPVDARRAEILSVGARLMHGVMQKAGADSVVVSESDNLEGFALMLGSGVVSAVPLVFTD